MGLAKATGCEAIWDSICITARCTTTKVLSLLCLRVLTCSHERGGVCVSVCVCTAMNEATWQQVAMWEQLHADKCGKPMLLRFMGKPHDLR